MDTKYTFTVFTPTFNRSHTLPMVYESLKTQTFGDFEWLIVDDGSKDESEGLIEGWRQEGVLDIRYIRQENKGKHFAFNRGVKEARGELFLTLDSDDTCLPCALERFKFHWDDLGERQGQFCGVTGLCADSSGRIEGDRFPRDVFDSDSVEIRCRYAVGGEKWGFTRTDILRECPFPEIENEKFITEEIVWNRIALRYKTRFINEILRIYEALPDGLSEASVRLRAHNPKGATLFYNEQMDYAQTAAARFKSALNYVRFSRHGGVPPGEMIRRSNGALLTLLALPGGWLLYARDRSTLTGGGAGRS